MNKYKIATLIVLLLLASGLVFYLSDAQVSPHKYINDASLGQSNLANWEGYQIKGSSYQIKYSPRFHLIKDEENKAMFANHDETIHIIISSIAAGFTDEWKECAPKETVKVLEAAVNIEYLCNGSRYLMVASTHIGLYMIALVPESEFRSEETKNMFKTTVSSLSMK